MKPAHLVPAFIAVLLGAVIGSIVAISLPVDNQATPPNQTANEPQVSEPTNDDITTPTTEELNEPQPTVVTESNGIDANEPVDLEGLSALLAGTLSEIQPAPFPGYEPPRVVVEAGSLALTGHVQYPSEQTEVKQEAARNNAEIIDQSTSIAVDDTLAGRYLGILIANGWATPTDPEADFGGNLGRPTRCLIRLNGQYWRLPCALPHNYAIEYTGQLANTFPGQSQLRQRTRSECDPDKTDDYFIPTQDQFSAGQREFHCGNVYGNGFFTIDNTGEFLGESGEFAYTTWLQQNGFSDLTSITDGADGTCFVRALSAPNSTTSSTWTGTADSPGTPLGSPFPAGCHTPEKSREPHSNTSPDASSTQTPSTQTPTANAEAKSPPTAASQSLDHPQTKPNGNAATYFSDALSTKSYPKDGSLLLEKKHSSGPGDKSCTKSRFERRTHRQLQSWHEFR